MRQLFGRVTVGLVVLLAGTVLGQTNSKFIFDDGSGSSQAAGGGAGQRAAVPDAGAVAAAMAKVEATYGDDLKNSTKPQDMVFLSQKLELLAGDDRDDAHCYAMLAKAKDLAIAGGSYEQTASVIDLVNERFDVDGPGLKWEAVGAVAKTAGKDQQGELAAGVAKLANDSMGVDRYDVALLAAQWCKDAAPPGDARIAANLLVDRVRETQSAYEAIKPALATLKTDPHNAEADLAVGKFKCYFKGDWNGGLTMLAAGSDATLKGLARDDLGGAPGADALVKLGDGWWDVAQQQNGIARDKVQLHAAAIYAEASEGLAGLDKAKVDKRVQEAMALHAKMSGTTALAPPVPPPAAGSGSGSGSAPAHSAGAKVVTNSLGIKLVWIKPGTFMMGSPADEKGRTDNEILHQVTLTKGFYMGVMPVTQEQWLAVEHSNPSHFHGKDLPVDNVLWSEAGAYCKALSSNEGRHYRLPTEAEWEYACRAGTQTAYYFGSDGKDASDYLWIEDNSHKTTHSVGGKKPNAWGLYDMGGDVCNWCEDIFGPLDGQNATDPLMDGLGEKHVVRGGAWRHTLHESRSANRGWANDAKRYNDLGFRVVMDAE